MEFNDTNSDPPEFRTQEDNDFNPNQRRNTVEPDIINTDTTTGTNTTDNTSTETSQENKTTQLSEIDAGWTDYFPFDEPYTDQVDGINAYINALATNDNMVMEGACGTGKTLVGLTAGIHYLRNHEEITDTIDTDAAEYSRILVATPVKQQLKQFIDEMQTINERVTDHTPLKTIVMRGQKDVLPYAYVDYHPFDEYPVNVKIDDLREKTIELIRFDSDIPLNWPEDIDPPNWSQYAYDWSDPSDEASKARDRYKFDPYRARAVVLNLHNQVAGGEDPLVVNGVAAPYPDGIPHTSDMVDTSRLQRTGTLQLPADLQGRFDPFYAGFFAHERMPFWFEDAPNSVMDSDALFTNAVRNGVCPHQAMADMMEHADVLIGNYYHVFDPETRLLTDMKTSILDEETICILDEAHNIEERVRDILSDAHGIHSFRYALNDVRTALGYLNGHIGDLPRSEQQEATAEEVEFQKPEAEEIFDHPAYNGVTVDDFHDAIEFFSYLERWLKNKGTEHLDDRFDYGWEYTANNNPDWISNEEISLGDPENEDVDELTVTVEEYFSPDIWQRAYSVSQAAQHIVSEVSLAERVPECESVGEFFFRWANESRTDFFREIILEQSFKDAPLAESHPWTKVWTPKYQLYNCIPTKKLREIFSELGSVMLMSATLEPIEEYVATTGVGACVTPQQFEEKDDRAAAVRSGEADTNDDITFRGVTVRRYPLRFPEENRLSMTVTAPKFTYGNRKSPTANPGEMTTTRKQYADLLVDIATTDGNVLLCLPSYAEARWAEEVLENRGIGREKNIVLDQSSSAAQTDENLESFFSGGSAVIITSNRGTITEGVDYDGDKLHVCAVIGLSLLPPSDRNKAVETAYDEYLDDVSGFVATNKIPAVRKARQAIGRVIRGDAEVGARILVDERYARSDWHGVKDYLSEQEQREFKEIHPEDMKYKLDTFWEIH